MVILAKGNFGKKADALDVRFKSLYRLLRKCFIQISVYPIKINETNYVSRWSDGLIKVRDYSWAGDACVGKNRPRGSIVPGPIMTSLPSTPGDVFDNQLIKLGKVCQGFQMSMMG